MRKSIVFIATFVVFGFYAASQGVEAEPSQAVVEECGRTVAGPCLNKCKAQDTKCQAACLDLTEICHNIEIEAEANPGGQPEKFKPKVLKATPGTKAKPAGAAAQ